MFPTEESEISLAIGARPHGASTDAPQMVTLKVSVPGPSRRRSGIKLVRNVSAIPSLLCCLKLSSLVHEAFVDMVQLPFEEVGALA